MSDKLRWVLPIPIFIFLAASWVFVRTENEVRVQVGRAQKQWRAENYREAVELYESVYQDYPKSQYADDVLWEVGTIYYVNFYDVDRALISFHRLVTQYPDSPLAAESYLKLAQIHEVELADLPKAIACWNQLLTLDISRETLRQVRFNIGNAHFKLNQFVARTTTIRLRCNVKIVCHVGRDWLVEHLCLALESARQGNVVFHRHAPEAQASCSARAQRRDLDPDIRSQDAGNRERVSVIAQDHTR